MIDAILNNDEIMNQLQQAVGLHQMGQVDSAIQLYQEILNSAPDTFDAIRLLGIARIQQGDADNAIALLEKARTLKPDSAEVQGYLGLAFKIAGRLEEAATCYRESLKANPNDTNTIINLGNLLMLQRRGAEASVLYQRATDLQPTDPVCHTLMGDALSEIGYNAEAALSYGKALQLKPDHVEAHNGMGLLLMDEGKLHDAILSFETALQSNPNEANVHNNLGQAFQRQHRYDKAAESFRKATVLDPQLAAAHNNLGGALFEVEDAAAALTCYEHALSLEPGFTPALLNQGIARFDGAALGPSLSSFEQAVASSPDNSLACAYRDVIAHQSEPEKPLPAENSYSDPEARSIVESYRYMVENGDSARFLSRQSDLHRLAMEASNEKGLVLEFGVFYGHSIRFLAALTSGEVHGFDSFEGIPENWFHGEDAGAYTTEGTLPPVPDNVTLHVGWFDDTLPSFKDAHTEPVRLANIDCDIYSSTKCIFDALEEQMVSGTVLIFDEYLCYPKWRDHEYKAFQEFIQRTGWRYEYLAYSLFTRQTVVRLTEKDETSV